jgi:hypothetical protein
MGTAEIGEIELVSSPASIIRMPNQTPHSQWEGTFIQRTLVAAAALLFALGFGLSFGYSNENTYLVPGVRLLDPESFSHDWFATQSTPYHKVFAYPAAALLALDSSGWLFALVAVVIVALGAVIVFKLVQSIAAPGLQLLVFLLVMLLALVTRTQSVADSFLYTREFEPATLGVTGFLLGMCLFVRGRYLLSGLALAAGGIFHANYLLLAFPVFAISHLILRRRGLFRPLLLQFAFPVVALLALLPAVVPIALQPGSEGTNILLTIRSPHHYQPSVFGEGFIPLLGWLLLLGSSLRRTEVRWARFSPAVALAAAMTVLIAVASALTTLVYVSSVAQLYVWRVAPPVVLLAQIFTARMVAAGMTRPEPAAAEERTAWSAGGSEGGFASGAAGRGWLLAPLWRAILVVAAGVCFVYYYYLQHLDRLVLEVLGAVLLLGVVGWALRGRPARATPAHARAASLTGMVLLATLALAILAGKGVTENSNLLAGTTPESQLYAWARTADRDAVFMIPPDMLEFRLSSRRAVVVDWKSAPFAPLELEEWYRRIDAVSGRLHPRTVEEATAGYAGLDARRLANLADLYIAAYVVRREPLGPAPPAGWRVVFDNGTYQVFQTGVTASAPWALPG